MKDMMGKHHSSSTLPITMKIKISTNLKYLDNCGSMDNDGSLP
jgi:hypothetical protein